MSVKPELLNLNSLGNVLATRETGREAADLLQEALGDGGIVVNFKGVEIATPSFLDEVVVRLAGLLKGNENVVAVMANMNPDVQESLELVLDKRGLALAILKNRQLELLGGAAQLGKTLAAAEQLKDFKAADLAKELKIKVPNVHQRLKALMDAGAITREQDDTAERGRRHRYKAPDPKKLGKIAVG